MFGFYERKAGMETAFYCDEERISVEPRAGALRRVSPAEYIGIREALLKDTPHVAFDERTIAYQERLCGDGGLFAGEGCCAIAEAHGGNVRVVELLGEGGALLRAIAGELPAREYLVRRPGRGTRFGMLSAAVPLRDAWLGPAFD